MKLLVTRDLQTGLSTGGQLSIQDPARGDSDPTWDFFGYTLEPPHPIDAGTYVVVMDPSPGHGGALLPHILDVPRNRHILIHAGNYPKDTKNCILVGGERRVIQHPDFIGHSHPFAEWLADRIAQEPRGSVTIEILDSPKVT